MNEIVTIGVYGFDADHFFGALTDAHVDTLCDIRRRRAVRGHEYAFANSVHLQERLAALGIRYVHRIELAPSDELRHRQERADKQAHTARRKRTELTPAFIEGYEQTVLDGFDSRAFAASLGPEAHIVAFLCVEREPSACHRGLLAARLHADLGLPVKNLVAGE